MKKYIFLFNFIIILPGFVQAILHRNVMFAKLIQFNKKQKQKKQQQTKNIIALKKIKKNS